MDFKQQLELQDLNARTETAKHLRESYQNLVRFTLLLAAVGIGFFSTELPLASEWLPAALLGMSVMFSIMIHAALDLGFEIACLIRYLRRDLIPRIASEIGEDPDTVYPWEASVQTTRVSHLALVSTGIGMAGPFAFPTIGFYLLGAAALFTAPVTGGPLVVGVLLFVVSTALIGLASWNGLRVLSRFIAASRG